MLIFLLCCFLHFVCCVCFSRFRVFFALFVVLELCLALCMQCLGEVSAHYVLFDCFLSFVPPDLTELFFLLLPPRSTRAKYCPSVPIWALPCLLPVSPHIKLTHCTHPNHPRTSVSFQSCVCAFCSKCVFRL